MLHGWHTQYSSFRPNEQEIFYASIHLSKNALYYYKVMEMVKACLTILDSIYLMCVNSLFAYWKSREWSLHWIKDKGNTYSISYSCSYSFSSFVQLDCKWIWIWICKLNQYYLRMWTKLASPVWKSPMNNLNLPSFWWLDCLVLPFVWIACQSGNILTAACVNNDGALCCCTDETLEHQRE